MSTQQKSKPVLIIALASALMAISMAAWVFLATSDDQASLVKAEPAHPRAVTAVPVTVPVPAPVVVAEREPSTPTRSNGGVSEAQRMARNLKREQIWSALGRAHDLEPEAPGSAAPSQSAATRLPSLDGQYIKSAIAEQLLPVAIECYESALEDKPELAGKLVTKFVIIGAEDVGGVVEDATIDDSSTLDDAFVRECIRESLIAVTFEPPPDGGRVEVTYPFVFEPE